MNDFKRGLEAIAFISPSFFALTRSIGQPIENENIPTAQVKYVHNEKKIYFEVNPHFAEKLSDIELGAVFAHETYHIVLNHLSEAADRVSYPDSQVLTHAHECIINDGLFGNTGLDLPEGGMSGLSLYGADFSVFSTKQAYDYIMSLKDQTEDKLEMPNDSESGSDSGEGSESNDSSEGHGSSDSGSQQQELPIFESCGGVTGVDSENLQDFKDLVSVLVNKAAENIDNDDMTEAIEDILDALAQNDDYSVKGSNGVSININPNKSSVFSNNHTAVTLEWDDLLAKINPKIKSIGKRKYVESWHSPRRKMANSYPEIVLPTFRENPNPIGKGDTTPHLILALDVSGSIPRYAIEELSSIAMNIPDKYIIPHAITWSDTVVPFDPTLKRIAGRFGTNIDNVLQYVKTYDRENKTKSYVLVITDGETYFNYGTSHEDYEMMRKNWFWMGIKPGDTQIIQRLLYKAVGSPDMVYDLKDFRLTV